MDRREFLKKVSLAGIGASLLGTRAFTAFRPDALFAQESPFDIAFVQGADTAGIVKKALEAVGGMSRFVSRGDVVMLKPNLGWARTPDQAANTDPAVLKTVVELCFNAGAKKVKITDNTCNDPRKTYTLSGADAVAKETGADIFYTEERFFRDMDIGGEQLRNWPVNREIIEADKLINIPVAKHHSLAKLTIGMKNWFGAVGGARNRLHQNIDGSIADLARFFKPALTVVDAVRILVRNGPTGGNLSDVKKTDTVIASTDPVAADSWAATLFDMTAADLGYIGIGERMGLGKADWTALKYTELVV
jgi:uncharacterized protein (DUF362 family)